MLGLLNLKDKKALLKLEKEELADLLLSQIKANEELLDKIFNLDENGLIEFQKDMKLYKALAKLFGVIGDEKNVSNQHV